MCVCVCEPVNGSMDVRLGMLIDRLLDHCKNSWSRREVMHVWQWSLGNVLLFIWMKFLFGNIRRHKETTGTLKRYKPASRQAKEVSYTHMPLLCYSSFYKITIALFVRITARDFGLEHKSSLSLYSSRDCLIRPAPFSSRTAPRRYWVVLGFHSNCLSRGLKKNTQTEKNNVTLMQGIRCMHYIWWPHLIYDVPTRLTAIRVGFLHLLLPVVCHLRI